MDSSRHRLQHYAAYITTQFSQLRSTEELRRGFYSIIGYTVNLSNKPHAVRTPGILTRPLNSRARSRCRRIATMRLCSGASLLELIDPGALPGSCENPTQADNGWQQESEVPDELVLLPRGLRPLRL